MRLTLADEHVRVTDEDLKEPLSAWDITALHVRRPDLGTMNETWIVDHRAGRSVLRRHRTTDIEAVRREHAVIDHVRAKGIPVPDIITNHDGDRVAAIAGRLYTLYSFEPGEHPPGGCSHGSIVLWKIWRPAHLLMTGRQTSAISSDEWSRWRRW